MNRSALISLSTGALVLAALSAGCGSSSGAVDSGPPGDAPVTDVGSATDAGVTPDAGSTPDVTPPADAGTTPDASTTPDVTPATDAGTAPDSGTAPDAGPHQERPMRVAYVEYTAAGRPLLWVQRPDGSERRQLRFTGVTDDVPGQDPSAPTVTDDHVRSVHQLAWSPDGVHLALVVSTAIDQSEVVVLDADAGGGVVVSYNAQYVMPALDWSADGRQLAYVMSTQPRAGALELVVSDVPARRWRRVTTGANLRGLSVQLRFVPDGRTVLVSRVEDQGTSAPWDWHCTLLRVDVATGARPTVERLFTGRIDAVSRDLAAVYAMRNRDGGGQTLVARGTGISSPETTVADGATLVAAAATPRDGTLLLTHDARTAGSTDNAWQYRVLRLPDATTRVDVPPAVERIAVWADPNG